MEGDQKDMTNKAMCDSELDPLASKDITGTIPLKSEWVLKMQLCGRIGLAPWLEEMKLKCSVVMKQASEWQLILKCFRKFFALY